MGIACVALKNCLTQELSGILLKGYMGDNSRARNGHSILHVYGVRGTFRLMLDGIATKLAFRNARLLRRPFFIRGKRAISIGDRLVTGRSLRLDAFPLPGATEPVLRIGSDVQLNDYVHIAAMRSVEIGNRVLIASHVFITDHGHGNYSGPGLHDSPFHVPPADRAYNVSPVCIEDDVWIGQFVSVLHGVTIGRGSIIGTMSVVTADIPPYCIAVGTPARVIKRFNFETARWEKL